MDGNISLYDAQSPDSSTDLLTFTITAFILIGIPVIVSIVLKNKEKRDYQNYIKRTRELEEKNNERI